MTRDGLTAKQERFVQEYMVDLNATQAAIRAGYARSGANVEGRRLLAKPHVQKLVAWKMKQRRDQLAVTAESVVREIQQIAFGDIRAMFDGNRLKRPDEWDEETAASVAGMEIVTVNLGEGEVEYVAKIKRADRLKALDMLARHLGLYNDRLNVEVRESLSERLARAIARAEAHRLNDK